MQQKLHTTHHDSTALQSKYITEKWTKQHKMQYNNNNYATNVIEKRQIRDVILVNRLVDV